MIIATQNNIPDIKTDYLGSKRLLKDFLISVISKIESEKVIDAFSGSSFVSHLLKKMGKEVHSNDILNYPFLTSKSYIENSKRFTLEPSLNDFGNFKSDYEILFSQPLKTHKINEVFGQHFYTEEENDFIELVRQNVELIEDDYLRSFIITNLCRLCLRRIEHGKYTHGMNLHYRIKYKINLQPIKQNFINFLIQNNNYIFDNGKKCKSYNKNILEWNNPPKADLVIMDPPYGGSNKYEATYSFIEGLTTLWDNWSAQLHTANKMIKTGKDEHFGMKKNIDKSFKDMFNKFSYVPNIIVCSNSEHTPSSEGISEMLKNEGYKDIVVHSKLHAYRQQNRGWKEKDGPKTVYEHLIVGSK